MTPQQVLLISGLVPMWSASAACSGIVADRSSAVQTGLGAVAVAGVGTGTAGLNSPTAGSATGGVGVVSVPTAGTGSVRMGSSGIGTGLAGTSGIGAAGMLARGIGVGGIGGIGAAGIGTSVTGNAGNSGITGMPSKPGSSVEDQGADCPLAALPDLGSLTANNKLPDPFKKLDGTRITTKAEWRCRREEIKKLAEKFAYGTKPAKPQSVMGTVSNTTIMVTVTDNNKSSTFSATVKLPTGGSAPYPAIIVYGGGGFGSPLDSAVINGEGIALISYDPYAVGKETGKRSPKAGAFYDIYGSNSTTGLLMAWGWGVSRIIDAIEQSDGTIFKADAVGVTGCSRFGKGSFIAGVFDERVALTMPVESGSAGVPIWRGIPGEGAQSLSSAYGEQPWFGDAFSAFTGSPTKAPIDTHESVAMIAPRGLFIMDNPHIANLGPKSASVAALAGAEVYKALGAADNISYFSDVQNGSHCSLRPEWAAPLQSNIRRFLTKNGNDPGVMKISASAKGNLADWKDWETPSLN